MMPHDAIVKIQVQNPEVQRDLETVISSIRGLRAVNSAGSPECDILIHEIGGDLRRELQLIQDLTESGAVKEFFLTSPNVEPDLLIQALRAGAREFISQPIKADEVKQCLLKALERRQRAAPAAAQRKLGTIVDVLGSKGGVGTTTTAVNLAASLKAKKEVESVALIDMNLLFGDIPLFLDLKPAYSWAEIVRNIARLDATFLMSILSKHPSGIYVLPPPTQLEASGAANPETIETILRLMQEQFDFIVIDSGQSLDAVSLKILELSDVVLLISILSLPCLINARRLYETFSSLGYPPIERVNLIINRYHKKSVISTEEAEEGIGRKITWLVPNDFHATVSAINQGKLLSEVARKADVTKNLDELAQKILKETRGEQKKKGLFSSN